MTFKHYILGSIWPQGRVDSPTPERLHQLVTPLDLNSLPQHNFIKNSPALLGFCVDQGIARNGGRVGASLGPIEVRKNMGGLCGERKFYDAGDFYCENDSLEEAQSHLGEGVKKLLDNDLRPVVVGGGHETSYGHFLGCLGHLRNVLIINFDAHFDLRPLVAPALGSSGTPFRQILNLCQENHIQAHYCCLGIQALANTPSLFQIAKDFKTSFLTADDYRAHFYRQEIQNFLAPKVDACSHIFVSVCLDVFSAAFAPGVSAPQPLGLTPWEVTPILGWLFGTGKVISSDLVELSPPFDVQGQTSQLAARLLALMLS